MAKTDLKIKSTNAATGASITTSVPYINPDANSATLKQFATKLNAFTTNNYAQADRVHTINVDTEQTNKLIPTLNYSTQSESIGNNQYRVPFTYTGDGELYIFYDQSETAIQSVTISKSTGYITVTKTEGAGAVLFSSYCMAKETDTYYSCALVRSIAIGA